MKGKKRKDYKFFPYASKWIIWTYGLLGGLLIPWTIYLGYSLPTRQLARHWDLAWVGLDIVLITSLLLSALFAVIKSKYIIITLVITSTLLILDAWFDVVSARSGGPFVASLVEALIFELPLAIITFSVAVTLINDLEFEKKR